MRSLRSWLPILMLGLAACGSDDKQTDPAPNPDPTYSMSRAVVYPTTGEAAGTRFAAREITGTGKLEQNQLTLSFTAQADKSVITFTVLPNRLAAGVAAHYSLKSLPDLSTGAATAHYALPMPAPGTLTRLYDSQWNQLTGMLHVTSYDATRRLLSGTYEMTINNLPDPLDPTVDDSGKKRGNMTVSGEFANLPLQ